MITSIKVHTTDNRNYKLSSNISFISIAWIIKISTFDFVFPINSRVKNLFTLVFGLVMSYGRKNPELQPAAVHYIYLRSYQRSN